ncbi:16S rRNA (adenine(1518)-N(6)/adenine(1519)-N(6))-dimethyltransferase RsmA [Buchnera aphidicola (Hyadaphis tataricae)]|uniref:Ribosomal RNA small subunit methyltransferase A n=2 Tax=Buchnera aphidicola TaxID=9 RepID=A0A4D6Y524_9GAMM|nr:16S rRNA (adenine(1518)-N(6)/adenine(1519)-N(6))-dimethyltransferase RsmA [Buchnera aphidicola (Hyadaphis tataricae)]
MIIKNISKHYPRKKYGQHFLVNDTIIDAIIKKINPNKKETLVEIGPGLGALTKPISILVEKLTVIEIDCKILNFLKNNSYYSKLVVFCDDVLRFNFLDLFNESNQLLRIFGNLPYNISTVLILFLFKQIAIIQDMHFMLQKEVAERLVANPGNKAYGRLSIIAQYYCNNKILLNVNAENFWPIPKVDSVFVNLIPHIHAPYFVYDINVLSNITKIAFQNRRKIVRHSLKSLFSEKNLIQLSIDPKCRAENISVLQYCQLSNFLYQKLKKN